MCKLILDTTYGEDQMNSSVSKAQMCVCTMPIYSYMLSSFKKAGITEYAVVGNPDQFEEKNVFSNVKDAALSLENDDIFYARADMPFLTEESIRDLLENQKTSQSKLTALYNIDDNGEEVFAGVLLLKKEALLKNSDLHALIHGAEGDGTVLKVYSQSDEETFAVMDRCDLALAESIMRSMINDRLMLSGVTMIDPTTVYIAPDVQIGKDTVIYPNVCLESGSMIGDRVYIGANTTIHNSVIGDECHILSSVILDSTIKHQTRLGPFAYIRPNSNIGPNAKIGDFVEVKNSTIGEKTSVAHLTYIGDSDVGSHINFGCGCVTVNYDGKNKYRCKIGDHSFIGCNTNLVAPVTVGEGAYIAAGSTITDEVPENSLAIARARQVNKTGWQDKRK